jgi:protocatechuate 3,4-dioxygenase alpha subunit
MMMSSRLGVTPSQTVGPFLHLGLVWADGPYAVSDGTPGAFWITGTVYDGDRQPVPDALIETWQADPDGRFDHSDDPRGSVSPSVSGFRGFARCETSAEGEYRVITVKPGSLPSPDGGVEAPHINVSVLGRGLLDRVVTRIYFPDEAAANAADPVLASVPAGRRATLVAELGGMAGKAEPAGDGGLRFDIRLQGEGETVFFAL